jgi:ATP-dependent RNA helicase DHX57
MHSLAQVQLTVFQLIAALVDHIIKTAEKRGGILIFLPGVGEIRQCIEAIQKAVSQRDAFILPLHANLSNNEQNKVFQPSQTSWKIIAATNVAEVRPLLSDSLRRSQREDRHLLQLTTSFMSLMQEK